ncbi:MAG: hypothetical protein KF784_11260 [Fimbriimonadaceae bacterium]|nr:hypothetical protein [Fimbriimonadaceae bacterium]
MLGSPIDIHQLLQQPFIPQGASTRVRVSVSPCGRYVLKTPLTAVEIEQAFRRYGIDLGAVEWSPCPGDALASADALGRLSMESYEVAWENLRDEAALLFIGMHPDGSGQFVILQQRVQLFVDFVHEAIRRGDSRTGEWAIDELLTFTGKLWK